MKQNPTNPIIPIGISSSYPPPHQIALINSSTISAALMSDMEPALMNVTRPIGLCLGVAGGCLGVVAKQKHAPERLTARPTCLLSTWESVGAEAHPPPPPGPPHLVPARGQGFSCLRPVQLRVIKGDTLFNSLVADSFFNLFFTKAFFDIRGFVVINTCMYCINAPVVIYRRSEMVRFSLQMF